jgi:PBSX family phage terminase large subunit
MVKKPGRVENLTPIVPLTHDKAVEQGRIGGKKSVEVRREKKRMATIYAEILADKYKVQKDGKEIELEGMDYVKDIVVTILQKKDNSSVSIIKEMGDKLDGNKMLVEAEVSAAVDVQNVPIVNKIKNNVMEFFSKAGKICPLFVKNFITLLEGGRNGGKSYQIADMILILVWERNDSGTCVCGREIQKSLKDSSYALLKDRITYYHLEEEFDCLDDQIRCRRNGVVIIFVGMREATRSDGVKSIHKLFLFWGEEAQGFSQATLDVLIPTLIRVEGCRMFFSMNRRYESDPVYNECKARENVLIITINYWDNPFCTQQARDEAEAMKITNYPKWEHIYGGKPQTVFEDSLWPGDLLKKIVSAVSFQRDNYCRVVVCGDPAQSNTEFSNEYGLHVVGKTYGGEGHHISDLSGKYSPNDYSTKAIAAYYEYHADAIVVETNAGGDYIKSAILSIDPTVIVKEVKAKSGQNKVLRAGPVANLAQMGKIKHICGGSTRLENQMSRMTTAGFIGAPGESPDRVDAYVWGFIDLFGLDNLNTSDMFFKASMFKQPPEKFNIIYPDVCYFNFQDDLFGAVMFDIIEVPGQKLLMHIKDYWKGKKEDTAETCKEILKAGCRDLHIPEDSSGTPLIDILSEGYVGIKGIDIENYISKKLPERVMQILPVINDGFIVIDKLGAKKFNAESGDLFTWEVTGYTPEDKTARPILGALCNAIFVEKGLS